MDDFVLNRILENKKEFIPHIFTVKQMKIIEKKQKKIKLANAENKQWYSSIKMKLGAMETLLKKNIYINTREFIPERLEKAIEILNKTKGDAFISGSFLYQNEYNDIDLFIISRGKKEKKEGNIHFSFIPKKALKSPIIQSAARASVSSFVIPNNYVMPKMSIFDYINLFQETALLVMQGKDDEKEVRDIIFHYLCLKKGNIPNSIEVGGEIKRFIKLSTASKLLELKQMLKFILSTYKRSYVKKELIPYSNTISDDINAFKLNDHLKFYKTAFDEVLEA